VQFRKLLFGFLGAVSTGFGVSLLLAPEFVRGIGPLGGLIGTVASGDPKLLLLGAGLAVAGYVTLAARSRPAPETVSTRTAAEGRFRAVGTSPPESVTTDRQTVAAGALDSGFESAVEHGDGELAAVRAELATVATESYAVATGSTVGVARQAVAEGTWTNDPVATRFLSERERPLPPVRARLALWLTPQRERRRRIERTIAAIEQLEGRR